MTESPPAGVPVAPLDHGVFTVAEIATRWGCSGEVVRYAIHCGELDGFRAGRRLIRVTAEALAAHEIKRGSTPGRLGPRVPHEPTESECRWKHANEDARMRLSVERVASLQKWT